MSAPSIVWFRRDLRLADQAALIAACAEGPVVPLYVLDDDAPRHHRMGGASRWWLHHSLARLDASLREKSSRLILRRGNAAEVITAFAKEIGAARVHALHHYEPWWLNAERAIAGEVNLVLHDGNYLHPPGLLTTGGGQPYKIFTPFWRALQEHMPPPMPADAPQHIAPPQKWPGGDALESWSLLPKQPDWASGFAEHWTPGEAGALARVADYRDDVTNYEHSRNLPSIDGSSRLSPHLHFGEISPATLWHSFPPTGDSVASYQRELGWRDYAQGVIRQRPDYATVNGRPQLDDLKWRDMRTARGDLAAWQTGRTGYPIVDAGMRQLWATGWMHNRVRMIAASFLIKHLLIDWRHGEQWFWDTLVDADYGNNAVNWQWVAGTGIDSNMFVRIMAPLVQSEKFDAGDYIRRWVPELAHIRGEAIHDPDASGCRPGSYPPKIIEHREARERALAAYRATG